jgi:hypothetical protein
VLKSKFVTIDKPAEGQPANRDAGKRFLLEEMPALRAERWARRAIGAMSRQELDVREEFGKLGFYGFYLLGLQALAGGDMGAIDGLMDEMLTCIRIQESESVIRPLGGDGDIWELSTLYRLRKELVELHMGFTFEELASLLISSAAEAQRGASQSTPTSPA